MNDTKSTYHKCGEIFFGNGNQFTYLCHFCNELFYEITDFQTHELSHAQLLASKEELFDSNINAKVYKESDSINYIEGDLMVDKGNMLNNLNEITIEEVKENVESQNMQQPDITVNSTASKSIEPSKIVKNENYKIEIYCKHCKLSYTDAHDINKCSKVRDVIEKEGKIFVSLLRKGIFLCCVCSRYFRDYKELHAHHIIANHCVIAETCKICQFYKFMNEKIKSVTSNSLNKNKSENIHVDKDNEIKKNSNIVRNMNIKDAQNGSKKQISEKNDKKDIVNIKSSKKNISRAISLFKCGLCGINFKHSAQLRLHFQSHNKGILHKCDKCAATFTTEDKLKYHMNYKHTDDQPFSCGYTGCKAKFKLNSLKEQHEKSHLTAVFKCKLCGNSYKNKLNLVNHVRSRHLDSKQWLHQCDICLKRFPHPGYLAEHKRKHSDHKSFKCSVCSKYFKHKKTLKEHEKEHDDNNSYKCHTCKKEFKQLAGYCRHIKGHLNIK